MTDEDLVPPVGLLTGASLVELAVERLRAEILAGTLAPGERLVEEQVTRRLGISRAPLREALRLLAEHGLVEHLPRRGVRVATLSDRDVDELFELRDVLERHALERALPVSSERLGSLRSELAAMRLAAGARDPLGLADAHRRFHVELVALAGQRQLLRAYEPVLLRLQLHMSINLRREAAVADPLDGVRRHAALLAALEGQDPAVVLEVLTGHGARTYVV